MDVELSPEVEELANNTMAWGRILLQVAIILVVGFLISRYGRAYVERQLSKRAYGRNGAVFVGKLISVMAWIIAAVFILDVFGVQWSNFVTLASAITLAIGFALQDLVKNFISGVFLLLDRPFRVGDHIRIQDVKGEVQGVDLRTTLVRIGDGSLVMVPNGIVFTEVLTNEAHFHSKRIDLIITTTTGTISETERTIQQTLTAQNVVRKPVQAPVLKQTSPEGTVFTVSVLGEKRASVESQLVESLVAALPNVKIEIEG